MRRSLYVTAFGLLHIALGFAVLAQVDQPQNSLSITLGQVVPPPLYGPASITVGVLCCLVPWIPVGAKWHHRMMRWCFSALAMILFARVLAHIWAFLQSTGPIVNTEYPDINPKQQIATACVYGIVILVHFLIASWPEPANLHGVTKYDKDPILFTEDTVRAMADRLLTNDKMAAADRRQLETDLTEIAQYGRILTSDERLTQSEDPIGRSTGRRKGQAGERAALHNGEETP